MQLQSQLLVLLHVLLQLYAHTCTGAMVDIL